METTLNLLSLARGIFKNCTPIFITAARGLHLPDVLCLCIVALQPVGPGYYHLSDLPTSLTSLSLAFELINHPCIVPEPEQTNRKLFCSGSKWFPDGVMSAIPEPLRGRLETLWVGSIMLATADLRAMKHYTHLKSLTCKLVAHRVGIDCYLFYRYRCNNLWGLSNDIENYRNTLKYLKNEIFAIKSN